MVKIQIFNVIKSLRRYTIIDVLIIFSYHNIIYLVDCSNQTNFMRNLFHSKIPWSNLFSLFLKTKSKKISRLLPRQDETRRFDSTRTEQRGLWGIFESVLRESWQFIGSVKGRKCSPVVVRLLEKLRYKREGRTRVSACSNIICRFSTPSCLQFESPLNRIRAFNVVTLKFHEVSLRISITRPMCVGRSIKICRCRANMGHRSVEFRFMNPRISRASKGKRKRVICASLKLEFLNNLSGFRRKNRRRYFVSKVQTKMSSKF